MSQAIRFNKGVTTNTKKTTKRAPSLEAATLKYGQTHALPATEPHSVLIFTEDTGEMFMGMGSQPIKKLSDVLVLPTINDFPAPGVKDRLYIAENTNTLHFWDGTQYQTAGTGSASITVTPRIFEFDAEKDFPATGVAPAIYIEKSTGKLFRFENGKYVALGAADEAPALRIEIQKLQDAMSKLQADKADKGEGITAADAARIAKAEVAKISIPDVSGLATKEEVAKKANATELLMKADKKEMATKADKIDLDKKADKADLDAKADKADLDNKADKADLDAKANKADLDNKADKSALDAYRKLDVAIEEKDLSQELQDKVKDLPIEFATTAELDAAFDAAFGGSDAPANSGTLAFTSSNANIADLVSASELASGKLSATQIDCSAATSLAGAFEGVDTLTELPEFTNTENVTDMSNAFKGMTKLEKAPTIDMSNVTDASGMFENCTNLTEV